MKQISQKIISGICIISLVFTSFTFYLPKTANAQFATFDAANFAQNTLTAIGTTASSFHSYFIEYKESILDGLAWMLVKQLLQTMTADVVTWINSGFQGNPAFITNPTGFFLDAVDQTTGVFLSTGGPLANFLCSPFSLDIRLTLALGHVTPVRERFVCTISTVINNVRNIPNNITINGRNIGGSVEGFVSGDFYQGGWPAFMAMSLEPQNDIYGAYLGAHSEMLASAASTRASIGAEIAIGRGFLSWKKCDTLATVTNDDELAQAEEITAGDTTVERKVSRDGNSIDFQSCTTQTPGSVISDTLSKQLGAPVDQLNIADEINEIVDALVARLVTDILTAGLGGVSKSRPGNRPSIIEEVRLSTIDNFDETKDQFLLNVRKYLAPSREYKDLRNRAYALVEPEKGLYDEALVCLNNKLAGAPSGEADYVEKILAKLNETLAEVNAAYENYQFNKEDSDNRVSVLERMEVAATTSTNPTDLLKISKEYSDLIVDQQLTSDVDIQNAKDDLKQANKDAGRWNRDANNYLRTCENLF